MRSRFRLSSVCLFVLVMLGGRLMQAQTLDEALNVPGGTLEFSSYSTQGPPYPWTVVTGPGATHDGVSAARSGATGYYYSAGNYIRSMLDTTLTGAGMLTFWTKRIQIGKLDFYINGVYSQTIEQISSPLGQWRFHQLKLPLSNQNTVQWGFENWIASSKPGQTEYYCLPDEVCWHPADEQGYVFRLNEDGISYAVWAYLGQAAEVNVPATVAGKPVTAIDANAFADNKNLVTVVLPSTLQYIGERAFYGCWNLKSVVIPATVQAIGAYAFNKCSLTSIVFADRGGNDITLGEGCFAGNPDLRECILPEGITNLPPLMLAGSADRINRLPAIRIPASVASLDSQTFDFCNNVAIFFMGTPPVVVEPMGRSGGAENLDNALVVYQTAHQADWAEVLDGEGRFCGFPTASLAGEPLPLPEIATPTDKPTFLDSVVVTFTLNAPLPGDKLLVERSEDDGATFAQTVLTPGESSGDFLAAGTAQWTCTLTASAVFRACAVRPANGVHSRCSGAVAKSYLRWNEYADALDNHTLEFALEAPKYWSVSDTQSVVGGSSLLVDLGGPEDNPPMHTKLLAQVAGPGLLACWIYPERRSISVTFGEVDPTGEGWLGFKEDGSIHTQGLASYDNNPKTWVKCAIAIPPRRFPGRLVLRGVLCRRGGVHRPSSALEPGRRFRLCRQSRRRQCHSHGRHCPPGVGDGSAPSGPGNPRCAGRAARHRHRRPCLC